MLRTLTLPALLALSISIGGCFEGCDPDENNPTGCQLGINGQYTQLPYAVPTCGDYYTALRFAGRIDFYRLLTARGHVVDEAAVLDTNNDLVIEHHGADAIDDFSDLEALFSSDQCETVEYFGVPVFCFNEINSGNFHKDSSLRAIIKYLTVVVYTSTDTHTNQLVNEQTTALDYIVSRNVTYYEALAHDFYGETLADTRCMDDLGNPSGTANHQTRSGESVVFMCPYPLTVAALSDKIHYAAILYHEANHKDGGPHLYFHDEDGTWTEQQLLNDTITSTCHDAGGSSRRDYDWASVYGAHITYLLNMSQNPILNCDDRHAAYERANRALKLKLCQYPNVPYHNIDPPGCR